MPSLTLLSPARDLQVAQAAIQAGADAVYIGAPQFGARQAAGNSLADIEALVRYAHVYGVQVLVTLNTLLRPDEYAPAVELAHSLYRLGVDALIIQDLHLLDFDLPPIRLHASTQCDNRTPEQVIRLRQLGFRRVVLARELTISEIRAIHEAVLAYAEAHHEEPIELEAFIHGALCVSYSGRCYMSEELLGRSANRGACAQMCRMQYDLLDADQQEIRDDHGRPIHQRYLLSLQDMDRSASLAELIQAGVTTFKIEGRLKDQDYVTNITAYYRHLLDTLPTNILPTNTNEAPTETKNSLPHRFTTSFTPDPAKTFHRGATDYFLHGRTPHMANLLTPKSTGEYIGDIVGVHHNALRLRLAPGVVLHNGDGLCYGDQGFAINRLEGDLITPNSPLPQPGDLVGTALYRNLDTAFVRTLHAERRIPIDILFSETTDGFCLRMGPVSRSFHYLHDPANNPEKALATIRTQLAKLGDTPFVANSLAIQTAPYFLPISLLNQWRREVADALIDHLRDLHTPLPAPRNTPPDTPQTTPPTHVEKLTQAANVEKLTPSTLFDEPAERPLMTCRYCLLAELGHCRKIHPLHPEPHFLRLRNRTLIRLVFDCKNCHMLLYKA